MIMSIILLFLQPLLNLFGATDQILGCQHMLALQRLGFHFLCFQLGLIHSLQSGEPLIR